MRSLFNLPSILTSIVVPSRAKPMGTSKILLLLSLSFSSLQLHADQLLKSFTVKQIFSEGVSAAGFYTNEPLPECRYGIMYMNLANESGKAMFALVLSAKAAGQTVNRIDYTVSATGLCMATGLHVK